MLMSGHNEIARPSEQDDPLAITPERLHQYYRTVQSEAPAEEQIDAAMSRRRARGRANRHRRSATMRWVALAGFLSLLLLGYWSVA